MITLSSKPSNMNVHAFVFFQTGRLLLKDNVIVIVRLLFKDNVIVIVIIIVFQCNCN